MSQRYWSHALMVLLVMMMIRVGTVWALEVPLTVKEVAGRGASGYPITVVVPVPGGAYQAVETFRVVDAAGAEVSAQVEVLNRWWGKDNSVRHVLVHFQPTVGAFGGPGTGVAGYRLRDDGPGVGPTQPVTVSETASAITLGTGAGQVVIQKAPFAIVTSTGPIEATLTGRSGVQRSFERQDVTVTIEERGPLRAVVRAEAPTVYSDPANHTHGWAVRVYVYAGKPWVKVDYQLQNSAKTTVYAAPLYFQSLVLNRPGGSPVTMRYMAELGGAVTASAVELIPAGGAWAQGLYWLDDMRHVVFETMYWMGDAPQGETFQYPPVATLPTSWYGQTRGTLDLGGIVPTVGASVKTDRRRPGAVDAAHRGWDNFYLDVDRKLVPSMAGGYAYSGSRWIATEDPADVYEAERAAVGELNGRPQWMAQYEHARDWPGLQLSTNPYAGGSWRKYDAGAAGGTLAEQKLDAPYLAGTSRRALPRDDQHGWFYHVEEAYYATGNLWIRDWYRFVGEFRRVFLERKETWPDGSSRGIGHALAHALQAYRVTGNPALLLTGQTPAVVALKRSILATGARDSSCCPPPPFESVFMTGYLARALINYLEEVEGDGAGVEEVVRGFVRWNVEHANFGYNVNPTNPNLQGVSSGTALTMGDPQAWYAWKRGDTAAAAHLNQYITTGINGGDQPYADLTQWTGDFVGRLTQFVRDGAPDSPPPPPPAPPPPPPPPPLTAAFTSPAAAATVSGTVQVDMTASEGSGALTFKLAVDGALVLVQSVSGTFASYALDTTQLTNAVHALMLTVTDGTQTASATRSVTVSNVTPPPSPPPGSGPVLPNPELSTLPANTAVDRGVYTCDQPADRSSGCEAITDFSGLKYDPSTGRMLMFGGGAEGDVSRTDIATFDLGTLEWGSLYPSTLVSAMTSANQDRDTGAWKSTGHPIGRPTFDMLAVAEVGTRKHFIILTSGGIGDGARIAHYDLEAQQWTYSAARANDRWYFAAAAAVDPISKKIIIVGPNAQAGAGNLWVYDPVNQHVTTGPAVPDTGYANNLVYFPPNQKMYLMARGTPTTVFEVTLDRSDWRASTVTRVTDMTGTPSSAQTGWAYDAVNQIIGGGVNEGTFYAYDPATRTWTSRTIQPRAGGSIGTVAFHALDYDPVNNVYVFVTDKASGRRTWVYRYAGDSPPPVPPPGVPPTPPPTLTAAITNPEAGATVIGTIAVGMTATGGSGTPTFELAVDGSVVWTQSAIGQVASHALDTTTLANGAHTLALTVTDGVQTATATRTVTVANGVPAPSPATPTVGLTASPVSILEGGSSTLMWTSTNAASCTAAGAWAGATALSGSQSVRPATTSTYTLTCSGAGGSASQSVTVTLRPPTAPPPGSGEPNPALASLPDNSAKDLGAYTCTDRPGDQPCGEITDFSRVVYDPANHQLLMFGGGHATTFRDDVDVFNLSALTWTPAYAPTPCADMTLANLNSAAGTWTSSGHPFSRHTYDMLVMAGGELIMLGGGTGRGGCAAGGSGSDPYLAAGKIHHYNPVTKAWTPGPGIGGWAPYAQAEYDPPSGKVIILGYDKGAGAGTLWVYDPVGRTALTTNIAIPDVGYAQNLVYYPPTQKHYLIRDGAVFEVTLNRSNFAGSTVIAVADTTGTRPPGGETGWAYDSVNQVIGGGVRNNAFYAYHPPTKTWSSRTMVSVSGGSVGTLAFHALDYDPVNNVFIFITDGASGRRTWAYRYAP